MFRAECNNWTLTWLCLVQLVFFLSSFLFLSKVPHLQNWLQCFFDLILLFLFSWFRCIVCVYLMQWSVGKSLFALGTNVASAKDAEPTSKLVNELSLTSYFFYSFFWVLFFSSSFVFIPVKYFLLFFFFLFLFLCSSNLMSHFLVSDFLFLLWYF